MDLLNSRSHVFCNRDVDDSTAKKPLSNAVLGNRLQDLGSYLLPYNPFVPERLKHMAVRQTGKILQLLLQSLRIC